MHIQVHHTRVENEYSQLVLLYSGYVAPHGYKHSSRSLNCLCPRISYTQYLLKGGVRVRTGTGSQLDRVFVCSLIPCTKGWGFKSAAVFANLKNFKPYNNFSLLSYLLRGTVPDLTRNRNLFNTRHKRGHTPFQLNSSSPVLEIIIVIDPIEIRHQAMPNSCSPAVTVLW